MTALAQDTWRRLLRRVAADAALSPLYGPLLSAPSAPDGCYVLGRIAQSLDGRIATATGASHWISGPQDIVHTHRLRALFDAVVIGAGTVRADDPQLTTREVEGPSPVRIVLDTDRRLDARYRVFREGPETLLLCAPDAPAGNRLGHAPVLRLPRAGKGLSIPAVIATLAERGLRRVFVEGGGITVSRFLAAGALDRLHVTIAPLLIGSGIPAFTLPETRTLTDVLRFDWAVHRIGADLLVDIPLSRARPGTPV
jgi:diaminohydroxyphosphoribosylaminopyrimidine deaminase / 5-amino-6-(5-phosphoribosylamino)uracil reductase